MNLLDITRDITLENVGNEAIAFQENDYFVADMRKHITELRMLIDKHKIKNNKIVTKEPSTLRVVRKIDDLIKKRFGINVTTFATEHFAAITPIVPTANNPIFRTRDDKFEEELKKYELGSEELEDWAYNYVKSQKEMIEFFKKNKIIIDRKKAHISGISNDIKSSLLLSYVSLLNILNDDEVIAIILHEIGHAFTSFEYIISFGFEANNLAEDLLTAAGKGNAKDEMVIVLQNYVDDDSKVETKNDVATLMISASTKLMSNMSRHGLADSDTESERVADAFATRFGMGHPLATGLHKVSRRYGQLIGANINTMMTLYQIVKLLLAPISLLSKLISFTVGTIKNILIDTLMFIIFKDVLKNGDTYDEILERLNKIRVDEIRRLKNSDIPKKDLKQILENYDEIRDTIDMALAEKVLTLTYPIKSFLLSMTSKQYNHTKFMILLNNVINNHLDVTQKRLESL